ncbi:Zn(2)-C6 fungal-type DNA-binding domain protein [Fusarium subglutinans]|uniref:Zn(2)-C6 fungal-type DNA-binding domain protein n=1 Tax=Gibberella subglutinans TaxID=42677 RepID=A0A8H5V5E7_GIBSU|nr:Zn(2)-C6 fungal-type DNA-binding domain protein [Fusarium subglutinans]KAF5611657.1 Zn(2)-C6 fungal-type DNA-binding domain protein [Fusarium subglutinans]
MNRLPNTSQRVVKPGVKKRRPPLACIQCYQRKLKCGRELPSCSRCSKAGNADECAYRGDKGRRTSVDGLLGDGPPKGADGAAASTRMKGSSTGTLDNHVASAIQEVDMTHLEGQGNSTKFYGYSYPLNLYQQFTDLRAYIVKIKIQYPSINSLRDEIYAPFNDKHRHRPISKHDALENTLRQLIPTKPIMDILVQTYTERYEITHRVLHIPTFIIKYNGHWVDQSTTPVHFLVQMLLVAATAASCHPEVCIDVFSHKTTHDHVLGWVEVAEAWLSCQSSQPPRSWDILVSHCLLLIAKRANFIKEGSFWTSCGTLVRWAMAAGYHRETVSAARIPPFCREMRRRLWVTIVELDLQASIERGMPPSVRIGDFNIKTPLNIDDKGLEESLQGPSTGMPITTMTNTSFQALLYRSLPVRSRICALINGSCEEVDFDKVLELEEELGQALRDIPAWDDTQADPRQRQTATYIKSMLGIVLHQYMLLLHFHFLVQTPSSPKGLMCRRARLEASTKILDYYQRLLNDEALPEQACRTGLILAALNICHEMYLNIGSRAYTYEAYDQSTITIFPQISAFLIENVEKVLDILEKRISLTFNGLNEYYIMSMTIGLIKGKLWPESAAKSDKEAGERVIKLCELIHTRQVALRQQLPFSEACDDDGSCGNQLSIDANYLSSDIMTDIISSMLPQDFDFINDNLDLTFFHA